MDNAPGTPKPIPFHLLKEITNNFSKDRRLGGGAYGDVYLGEHKDGEKIAVKVLKDVLDHLDDEQFEKEYHNLASLHHKNIVRLVGYCNETCREFLQFNGRSTLFDKTKRVLCFEYMHNRSLAKFISDGSNRHNWRTCYTIIKGICEGLEYLHEKLESPMYHLDLKPDNVLLDETMSPKIVDFGISRLVEGDTTKTTKSEIGTHGYRPPEYIEAAVISIKFDIYSLGVVIIKIMTGRDGYFRFSEMSSQEFIELVHTEWMNRIQATSVDMYSTQVRRCIEIALSCVEADRHKRPSIGEIVKNLNKTESPSQLCPCIFMETEMLDIMTNKLISYPLHVTDNRGRVHEATITTVRDPAGNTSTFQTVRPRIKIIDCTKDLGDVGTIDAHSTEPWILVCHFYGDVSIWNYQKQSRMTAFRNIDPHDFGEKTAKFIEPLQCFVVGDRSGHIHVYSYVKADKLQQFRAHADWVHSLAVHPSEPFLLSASTDKLIKLWNWEIGWQCIRTFKGHSDFVRQVKFNPQSAGNTFASSSSDSTIKIWNIHSPTPVATLDCSCSCSHIWNIDYFIPSGDRQYLVAGTTAGAGDACIWDLQTNTRIKQIEGLQGGYGRNIAVVDRLPGRPILVTVSQDRTVAFCDTTTHRYENRVNFKVGGVYDFAYINAIKSLAIAYPRGIAIMEI